MISHTGSTSLAAQEPSLKQDQICCRAIIHFRPCSCVRELAQPIMLQDPANAKILNYQGPQMKNC